MAFSPEALLKRCPPDLARRSIVRRFIGADKIALQLEGGLIVRFAKDEAAASAMAAEERLLAALRGRTPLAIPEIRHAEYGIDSYLMIPGVPFTSAHWEMLTGKKRYGLIHSLADFLAAVHGALAIDEAEAVGLPPCRWPLTASEARTSLAGKLEARDALFVDATLTRWEALAAPRHELRVLHNDLGGHNFAFDEVSGRLVGIFDFSDACVGNLHQDFHYFDGYGAPFAEEIQRAYTRGTGLSLRREEIELRHAAMIISQAAFATRDPELFNLPEKLRWLTTLRLAAGHP